MKLFIFRGHGAFQKRGKDLFCRGRAVEKKARFGLDSRELIYKSLEIYAEQEKISVDFQPDIYRSASGKPYFQGLPIAFSVSHSANIAVVAMSEKNVGADVEFIRHDFDYRKIAGRFFTGAECRLIGGVSDFFDIWTAKEAYSKYTSVGIASFRSFSVAGGFVGGVKVRKLDLGAEYSAHAVCGEDEISYIEV